MRHADGRSIGGRRISEAFRDPHLYENYSDVVVDITALPRGLYFPLIGTLLDVAGSPEGSDALKNLHIVVAENPGLDHRIMDEGGDQTEWMYGFTGSMSLSSQGDAPRIWAPVLGEGQAGRLSKYQEFVKPREICPVLPLPADDPRRGDELIVEYRDLLFDNWRVEPRDILQSGEQNPFDLYRQLCGLDQRYSSALEPLGGARIIVSSHSSKLLSLGVLLAAYDRDLAIPHIEPTGYIVRDGLSKADAQGTLFEVWLAGEAYTQT
jgi:hypothetical protein